MATAIKTSELHFIVQTGVANVNPEDRVLIRSHVMKGKNLGKIRPTSRRKDSSRVVMRYSCSSSPSSPSSSTTPGPNGHPVESPSKRSSSYPPPAHEPYPIIQSPTTVPRQFGWIASTICLPDSLTPASIEIVLQCECFHRLPTVQNPSRWLTQHLTPVSSIAKQLLYPLQSCIFFARRAENWIAPLAVDPAYLHSTIFTSLYYFDVILPKTSSHAGQRILHHHHKALSLVRERLLHGGDDARLSNNTVSVILGLTGQTFWMGDLRSAANHMDGMRKIVHLRGGLHTFRDNEKLLAEILRCDLGIAVHSGTNPVFFDNASSSAEPRLPYPALAAFLAVCKPDHTMCNTARLASATTANDIGLVDKLVLAWNTLSDFCSVIDLADTSGQLITVGTFLETMASVMYRLLDMHFAPGSRDETIRLGLLCFSCSVFLHWHHLGVSYDHLASLFRNCFATLDTTTYSSLSPQVTLWLLMVGAVSVFDDSDHVWLNSSLRKVMGECEVVSWHEMRHVLVSFMWIGLVHDKMGKRVFASAHI